MHGRGFLLEICVNQVSNKLGGGPQALKILLFCWLAHHSPILGHVVWMQQGEKIAKVKKKIAEKEGWDRYKLKTVPIES